MFASVNSGRPPLTGGCAEVIVAFFEQSAIVTDILSTAGDTATVFASMEFGRTVMIATPCATFECTVVDPPKTICVALISAATSIASVIKPDFVAIATRPAISFPVA